MRNLPKDGATRQRYLEFEPEPPKVRTARHRPPADPRWVFAFQPPTPTEFATLTAGDGEGERD